VARKFREIKARTDRIRWRLPLLLNAPMRKAISCKSCARAVIGTNNMDNCSRYCQAPATQGLFRTVDYGGDSGSIRDIETRDSCSSLAANTAEPPGSGHSRKNALTSCTAKSLIVSDLRDTKWRARRLFLHPKPGTDIVWLSAVQPLSAPRTAMANTSSGSMGE